MWVPALLAAARAHTGRFRRDVPSQPHSNPTGRSATKSGGTSTSTLARGINLVSALRGPGDHHQRGGSAPVQTPPCPDTPISPHPGPRTQQARARVKITPHGGEECQYYAKVISPPKKNLRHKNLENFEHNLRQNWFSRSTRKTCVRI